MTSATSAWTTVGTSACIELTADRHAAAKLCQHVSLVLQAHSLGSDVVDAVELLVTELIGDIARHEGGRLIKVAVVVDADGATTVEMTGGTDEPPETLAAMCGMSERSPDRERVLSIVDSVAGSWGTRRESGRATLWFTVRPRDTGMRDTRAAATPRVQAAVRSADSGDLATRAAATTARAAVDAAATAADAARTARTERATAANVAAEAVARAAAATAHAVREFADEQASAVAAAAATAATTMSDSIVPGHDVEAAQQAVKVQATVTSAAAVTAEQTTRAAAVVARDVASAAAGVASTTAAQAAATEQDVLHAATVLREITTATARQLAAETVEQAAVVALASGEAIAASERLREAHRQLERAGVHDRAVALALQEAMLTRLPESDSVQFAARYRTAAEQDQVGGDWYDAIALPTGTTSLVIGDVIGHDIQAAATMGQLRNILRALVWDRDEAPSAVVARLDRAIDELHIETMATLVLLNIEPPEPDDPASVATLRWSNAGHPAPVLIHADGTAIALDDTTDLLLGVRPGIVRRDHTHPVPPRATLFLYTDGLVETRTDDLDDGQQRLLDSISNHHHLDPGELLDAVLDDMVGDRPSDDVAALAVRFQPV